MLSFFFFLRIELFIGLFYVLIFLSFELSKSYSWHTLLRFCLNRSLYWFISCNDLQIQLISNCFIMVIKFKLLGCAFWVGFVFKEGMLVIIAGPSVGDLSLKEESPFSPPRVKYVLVSLMASFLTVIPSWLVMCNIYSQSRRSTQRWFFRPPAFWCKCWWVS